MEKGIDLIGNQETTEEIEEKITEEQMNNGLIQMEIIILVVQREEKIIETTGESLTFLDQMIKMIEMIEEMIEIIEKRLTFLGLMMIALLAQDPGIVEKIQIQEVMTEDRKRAPMEMMNLMIDIASLHLKEGQGSHLRNLVRLMI